MLTVKLLGNARVKVVQVSRPEAGKGWVVIKTKASGICGSTLHSYFSTEERKKSTTGHEVAGEVFEVGDEVSGLKLKDRVAINGVVSCGMCKFCQRGNWVFCKEAKAIGGDLAGGDAEYLAVPEKNCFLLPCDLSFE